MRGLYMSCWELPRCHSDEESTWQCGRHIRGRFDPWVRKIPCWRKWHLTPVFLPGKPHGERSLVGDRKSGCKESDTTEHTHTYTTLNVYSGDQSTVDGVMCGKVSSFWKMTLLVMQIIWGMCKRESVKSLSCVWLCDPMNCSPPGSSLHEILQVRILRWVSISSSRGSSQPRDQNPVPCNSRRILYQWTTWEVHP